MNALDVDQTRDGIARLLAHDLRAPMGPLVLAISTLAEDPSADEGTREIARLALGQADRMVRLMQATLWALRAPDPVPVVFAVRDAARDAVGCAGAIGVECAVRAMDDVRAHGAGSRVRDALAGVIELAGGAAARASIEVRADGPHALMSIQGEPIDEPAAGVPTDARAAMVHGARALFTAYGGGLTLEGTEVRAWLPVA